MAEIRVVDEPVTVVVSPAGWVRALEGHEVDAATLSFKAVATGLYGLRSPAAPVDPLIVIGSNGRVLLHGGGWPARWARRRTAITTLIDSSRARSRRTTSPGSPATTLLLAGTGGFGLMAKLGDLRRARRAARAS